MKLIWNNIVLFLLLSSACGSNELRLRTDDYFRAGHLMPPSSQTDEDCDNGAEAQSAAKNCSQLAANIAAKAAQVATAANEAQSSAAESAAKEVRIQLAGKAQQASRAAQAVLAGKQALLERIQRELSYGEVTVTKLTASVETSEANAQKAEGAAKSVEANYNRLSDIVQLVGKSMADVDAMSEMAQNDLNEKNQMLLAAKERGDRIQKQIACAREEYQQVKVAAYQAACAAVQAKQKAAASADHNGSPKSDSNSSCNKNKNNTSKCNTQTQRTRSKRHHQLHQLFDKF